MSTVPIRRRVAGNSSLGNPPYTWDAPGAVVEVEAEHVAELLAIRDAGFEVVEIPYEPVEPDPQQDPSGTTDPVPEGPVSPDTEAPDPIPEPEGETQPDAEPDKKTARARTSKAAAV